MTSHAAQNKLMDNSVDLHFTELRPTCFLEEHRKSRLEHRSTALIILNSPIHSYQCLQLLYNHAQYTLCADGGANRLYDLIVKHFPDADLTTALNQVKPDCIHGDLDSLDDEVRQRYEALGIEISRDPDQYSTDFAKAIKKITSDSPACKDLLILGSVGGRVDQGIGLLHEIYREQERNHSHLRLWLFSETSISVLLKQGETVLHTPLESGIITPNVGILPLYGRATITLKGFEWDVEDWPTEMGGQMSTSNHIVADRVSVTTDRTVLFTVETCLSN